MGNKRNKLKTSKLRTRKRLREMFKSQLLRKLNGIPIDGSRSFIPVNHLNKLNGNPIDGSRSFIPVNQKEEKEEECLISLPSNSPPRDPLDIVLGPGPSHSSQSFAGARRGQTYSTHSPFTMPEHTSASILKISDEKILQLINLYHNEECLWNTNSEDYKKKHKRAVAAEKIAAIMDLPNFKASHVIAKFKNLRDAYAQELKKIKQSQENGDLDLYTPKVFWWDMMDSFLEPHIRPRKDESSLFGTGDSNWVEVDIAEPTNLEARDNDSRPKRRKYNDTESKRTDDKDKSIAQALKKIQSDLNVLRSREDDHHESFGKYVASLMRSLPPQKALALQPQIVSLITGEVEVAPDPHPETLSGVELKFELED